MACPKLLILDCDGVLVKSEAANLAYYNLMFRRFALPEVAQEDRASRRLLHTLSTPQVIEHFFPENLRPEVRVYAAGLEYETVAGMIEPEPGWVETLSSLKARMKVCVATNRGRSAPGVIEAVGLTDLVDHVFMVHDVKNPKPAPDLIELAISHFGVSADEAVYVGDSELDRKASMGAGVKFIGFRTEGDIRISHPCELESLC